LPGFDKDIVHHVLGLRSTGEVSIGKAEHDGPIPLIELAQRGLVPAPDGTDELRILEPALRALPKVVLGWRGKGFGKRRA